MRTIKYIIQKEFIQVFRNKTMLPVIFVVPIVQLLIIVHVATFEMKSIKLLIIDKDLSSNSRQLISKFEGSPFYKIKHFSFNQNDINYYLKNGDIDAAIEIPKNFEKKIVSASNPEIQISIDAVNGSAAGLINAYTNAVIFDFNKQIASKFANSQVKLKTIKVSYLHWFNPELNYKTFMVPGILVILITMIGALLSGMNIVREKEIGTIEQINVTPIKKYQFIIGKLLPFWILALFELAFGLLIGKIVFDIPMVGSLILVFFAASVYLITILGIGLFVSTVTNTQQQAMFVTFFFILIFILMSGLFTPAEGMPEWAQFANKFNPIAYMMKIMRMVLLKGSEFKDIITEIISLFVFGLSMLTLSVLRYRKTN